MTTQQSVEQREAFEAWAIKFSRTFCAERYADSGNYIDLNTELRWQGWQAALSQSQSAQAGGGEVVWNVLRIGNHGAAYDPPGAHRAFTYDRQPGNVHASQLGRAANAASKMSAGDSIDSGLALLKALQSEGFGVFQIDTPASPAAAAVPDVEMARHWIDRYASGIDHECQIDRVCEALGVPLAAAQKDGA